MLNHELLTVAATAYENGRTAGQVTVFLLIGAVLYCGCVVDEAMKRNGTGSEELARLNAEMEKVDAGGPVPAVMTDAINLCLPKAPAG